jgi:hypothetical protein
VTSRRYRRETRAVGARFPKLPTGRGLHAFLATGTAVPATLMFTDPSGDDWKTLFFTTQTSPNPTLVVAGCPWTMRPSFLPLGSI